MTDVEKILKEMPSVKMGLDDFYGRQTVLNALNKVLNQVNKNDLLGVVSTPVNCVSCGDKTKHMYCGKCYHIALDSNGW